VAPFMPIVSINLSPPAYFIYEEWKKERRGSEKISSAVIRYEHSSSNAALLMPGDKRESVTGQHLVWNGQEWGLDG